MFKHRVLEKVLRKAVLAALCVFFPLLLWGQWGVGGTYLQGEFLKHSKKIRFDAVKPARAFVLEVMKQSQGRKYWSRIHGYPRVGLGFFHLNFGNDSIMGSAWGVVPQIDIWLLQRPKFRIYNRLGFGFCYVTRGYDPIENPLNLVVSMRLNNLSVAGIMAEYNLTPQLTLHAGGFLSHCSNGHLRFPNLGINNGTLGLGLRYQFQPTDKSDTLVVERYALSHKPMFGFRMGIAGKEANVANGPIYYSYTLTPHVIFPQSGKSQWSAGMELTIDNFERATQREQEEARQFGYVTVFGAHEWIWGRVGFPVQLHVYAYPIPQAKRIFYQKIGPKIYLLPPHTNPRKNIYFALSLKAVMNVADYVELSVGGTF